jgi:catechol 2,3-dioxygenase-like lactoylglutathione lyase family enzyme
MSDFTIGKLAQIIHVVGDLGPADDFYREVFGAERFYQGFSPYEKRDASLMAIGNFTIEPMAASADGADYPVGRFYNRFGQRLHSIALNVKGVVPLAERLTANGVRTFGPGGVDPTDQQIPGVESIFTHPKDSHCLFEFVDFGPPVYAQSPRLEPGWDPTRWRHKPLGIQQDSHVTVIVRDVEVASRFFTDVLDAQAFHESAGDTISRFVLLGEETVVELAQPKDAFTRAGALLESTGEMVYSVSFTVADLDAAADHLTAHSVGIAERTESNLVLDPEDTLGAILQLTSEAVPGDPRLGGS